MTSSSDKKLTVLTVLVAVLLIAVAVQSVYMFGLHRKQHTASDLPTADSVVLPGNEAEEGTATNSPPLFSTSPFDPAPFDYDPFDWKLDDWDPFKEMHSMHDRINQMFGNAFNRFERSDDFLHTPFPDRACDHARLTEPAATRAAAQHLDADAVVNKLGERHYILFRVPCGVKVCHDSFDDFGRVGTW